MSMGSVVIFVTVAVVLVAVVVEFVVVVVVSIVIMDRYKQVGTDICLVVLLVFFALLSLENRAVINVNNVGSCTCFCLLHAEFA